MSNIKEIIEAYKAGRNPANVQKYVDEHPEEVAHTKEVIAAYQRGENPASVKQAKDSEGIVKEMED